jgi:hypothetical protein
MWNFHQHSLNLYRMEVILTWNGIITLWFASFVLRPIVVSNNRWHLWVLLGSLTIGIFQNWFFKCLFFLIRITVVSTASSNISNTGIMMNIRAFGYWSSGMPTSLRRFWLGQATKLFFVFSDFWQFFPNQLVILLFNSTKFMASIWCCTGIMHINSLILK